MQGLNTGTGECIRHAGTLKNTVMPQNDALGDQNTRFWLINMKSVTQKAKICTKFWLLNMKSVTQKANKWTNFWFIKLKNVTTTKGVKLQIRVAWQRRKTENRVGRSPLKLENRDASLALKTNLNHSKEKAQNHGGVT